MNCQEVQRLVMYDSAGLDAVRASALRAHLETCSACREQLQQQRELDHRLRAVLLAETLDTSEIEHRVRENIRSNSPPITFSRTVLRFAAVAAAVLLAAVAAWRYWSPGQPVQICADAAHDHLREVVGKEPRRWVSERPAIDALADRMMISVSALSRFAAPGYHLERARVCRLDRQLFLHLVYSNGAREFSLFLRPERSGNGAGFYAANFGQEHIASVLTNRTRAVIVSEESAQLAAKLARMAERVL